MFSFSNLQSGSNKKSQMTKRVNHVISSPNQSSTALEKDTSIPPPINSGPNPSAPPPPPSTVIHTKEATNTKTQDNVTENPESDGVLTSGRKKEEPESRTFDQVLASLTELTEKYCKTVQVKLCIQMEYSFNQNILIPLILCTQYCTFQLQKRTLDEIKRRLGILSKQWEEGKLSQPVQTEMTKLTLGTMSCMFNTFLW